MACFATIMNFVNNSYQGQPDKSEQYEPDDDMTFGKSMLQFIWETVKVVVISLLIIIPVRYFLIQPFFVNGASMEPNFHDHEYLIIDEISYRFRPIERGDIVVFRYPRDPSQFFIKRVIGLPGETMVVRDGGVMVINESYPSGIVLDESVYLEPETVTRGDISVTLSADQYYVLGDNRGASLDSRTFGPIERSSIVGRAWIRGWPIDKVKVFDRPAYSA